MAVMTEGRLSDLIRMTKDVNEEARIKLVRQIISCKTEVSSLKFFEKVLEAACADVSATLSMDYRGYTYRYNECDGFSREKLVVRLSEEEAQAIVAKDVLSYSDIEDVVAKTDARGWLAMDPRSAKMWLTKANWTKPYYRAVLRIEKIGGEYDQIIDGIASRVLTKRDYRIEAAPSGEVDRGAGYNYDWTFEITEITTRSTETRRKRIYDKDGNQTDAEVFSEPKNKTNSYVIVLLDGGRYLERRLESDDHIAEAKRWVEQCKREY